MLKTLTFTTGTKKQTARIIGISKRILYNKLEKYRLKA
ncbi:helix-turn-helix domain-containing protein [Candidatus Omnitrophota bacterium]